MVTMDMVTMDEANRAPRCTEPACPVRWSRGSDRPCRDHAGDDHELGDRMSAMGIDPAAAPAGRHDGPPATPRAADLRGSR